MEFVIDRQIRISRAVPVLTLLTALAGTLASAAGLFSRGGPGPFEYESIRGHMVPIYGHGLYRHMSAEVAPQGIAQDVVTLFLAVPLLLVALYWAHRRGLRGRIVLAGVLGYFVVTYLMYLVMGMYNPMFLAYVAALCVSFFALASLLLGLDPQRLHDSFVNRGSLRTAGIFLIANGALIALLWLSIVIPPLISGEVPVQVEHYTTLVVQGLDLALLLPLSIVSGYMAIKGQKLGSLLTPVYIVFLALLMTALSAKIVAMGLLGYEIIPVVFIIPTLNIVSAILAVRVVRSVTVQAYGQAF